MNSYPTGGRILQCANPQQRQRVFKPLGAGKPAVCQQSVVTNIYTHHRKQENPSNAHKQTRQTVKPRDNRQKSQAVHKAKGKHIALIEFNRLGGLGDFKPTGRGGKSFHSFSYRLSSFRSQ